MMAEEIVQRLGFETGDAITNIDLLKSSLEGLNASLTASASAIRIFNSAGGGFEKAIADLTGKVDQISQKLESGFSNLKAQPVSFDTSAALNQINQLTSAWGRVTSTGPEKAFKQQFASMKASLSDYVNQNQLTRDQVIQAFAGTLSGSTPAINGLKNKVAELKTAFNSIGSSAGEGMGQLTGFISQLGRIIAFRAIISTLNDIGNGISEGTKSAADFSLRLGQISAITDDTSISLNQVRKSILETSTAFARPLDETTLAYYQTLQNQVGNAAESMYVFQQAAKLSAANVAPLNDSVNLVTAAIKGWNLNIQEAGNLSGMFFEAIKIGRMEASDLADILGRVGPTARQMGVSVQEAMAAVAIMTQQGTRADTAITQLNAVMSALIKPTKDLKKVMLEKWGVENAEQAVAKFGGLLGVLKGLENITGGTSNEMAKFTANVRALRGEMGLLGPNAKAAEDALNRLSDASVSTADIASKTTLDTAGGRYKQSVQELANAWTKLGEEMLPILTIIAKVKTAIVDWASSTAAQVAMAGVSIGVLIGLFRTYISAVNIATAATLRWTIALLTNPYVLITVGTIALGVAIATMFDNSRNRMKQYFDDFDKRAQKQSEDYKQQLTEQSQAQKQELAKQLQEQLAVTTRMSTILNSYYASIRQQMTAVVTTVKSRFTAILSAEQNYIQKAIQAESEAAQKIAALKTQGATQAITVANKEYNLKMLGMTKERQTQLQLLRGDQLRAEALSKLSSAKTPEDLAIVNELLQQAQAYYEQSAAGADNLQKQRTALTSSLNVEKDRQKVTEKQINLTKQDAQNAKGQVGSATLLLTKTQDLFKTYEDGLKAISKAKTAEEFAAGITKVTSAWGELNALIATQAPQAKDFLGLSTIHNTIVQQLQDLPALNLQVMLDMKSLTQQLEAPMATLSAAQQKTAGVAGWTDLGGSMTDTAIALNKAMQTNAASIITAKQVALDIKSQIEALSTKVPSGDAFEQYLNKIKAFEPQLMTQVANVQSAMTNLLRTDPMDTESFNTRLDLLKQKISEFMQSLKALPNRGAGLNINDLLNTDDFLRAVNITVSQVSDKFKELNNLDPIQLKLNKAEFENQLKGINSILEPLKTSTQEVGDKATVISNRMSDTNTILPQIAAGYYGISTAAGGVVAQCNNIYAAATQALAQVQALLSAQASAGVTAAYGAVIHRATGGGVRWTDTVNAMLTPGEVVVNASAAKQFYPQLNAMNAGSHPIFRDKGGPVTNVGDINVSVNGGDTSQQTIKSIASGLRRGMKRGTITLN